jgi:hypothetical protein
LFTRALKKGLPVCTGGGESGPLPIRIAIDPLAWNQKTGFGRFCREIVSALLRIPTHYSFTLLMDADATAPPG